MEKSTIMAVDDNPANLGLLENMLSSQGHRVLSFPSGEMALRALEETKPDLILLDINMPGMNGYEICTWLKKDARFREIPVIFISAVSDSMEKVKAFSLGAVDYVTKPFNFAEVRGRIAAHIELQRQKRKLHDAYQSLQAAEEIRDSLVHMVVHDMNTPLTSASGFLQLALAPGREEKAPYYIRKALNSLDVVLLMTASLLDVSRMESGEMTLRLTALDIAELIDNILEKISPLKKGRQLEFTCLKRPLTVKCDAQIVERIIQNILGNSLKFTSENDGRVFIEAVAGKGKVRISVSDNGPGIPEEFHERIFDKFAQLTSAKTVRGHSAGLGLAFCKMAVEAHGGRIGLESEPGRGSVFWFELPLPETFSRDEQGR